ncbi:MAG: nitroreductase [Pseudomonadota bacterium]
MDLSDYMHNRRSSLSLTLEEPGPDEAAIASIVTIASRVPDHGKLAPWRFELWPVALRQEMHGKLSVLIDEGAEDKAKVQAGTDKLLHAPCVIAVVSTASEHPQIPEWEQVLSAGAACMNMLIAANAHGFEAQWLTAWYIYDERARDILGLYPGEQIAGLIHIGTNNTAKTERPRPALNEIYSVRTA